MALSLPSRAARLAAAITRSPGVHGLLVAAIAVGVLTVSASFAKEKDAARTPSARPTSYGTRTTAGDLLARRQTGFRTSRRLHEHFVKHGYEFGAADPSAYLRLAQSLRDRPKSNGILEGMRADGVMTRFDRQTGAFVAYDLDGTIRTFFKPAGGEQYFLRQVKRGKSETHQASRGNKP